MRWLVALLCDSGLRLGEATGLAKDDLVLDHSVPHIKVKPHPWRSLKTVGSERGSVDRYFTVGRKKNKKQWEPV